jgi:hypothetical protein
VECAQGSFCENATKCVESTRWRKSCDGDFD